MITSHEESHLGGAELFKERARLQPETLLDTIASMVRGPNGKYFLSLPM